MLETRTISATNDSPPFTRAVGSTRAEAEAFNRRGLFIGGCPKSGTTLLLSLLDGHPQLVVLPEETFFLEKRGLYAQMRHNQDKLKFLLEQTDLRLLNKGRYEPERESDSADARDYSGFDYQRFAGLAWHFVQQPYINDSLLFSEIIRAYAIISGNQSERCVHWVEKSTSNEVRHEAMDELFPDARLIQLVRDPRAVFASRKKRLMNRYGCHGKAHRLLREWNRSAQEIPRLRREPSRFLIIRYEDLVKHPEKILAAVCRLGGFEVHRKLFEPTRAGVGWQGNSSFQSTFDTITAAPVDQWKSYLTPHEIWWVEWHCRRGMELAGYPLQTTGRFSLLSWLKRLPGESWIGYLRGRRASFCQLMGWLKECRYRH